MPSVGKAGRFNRYKNDTGGESLKANAGSGGGSGGGASGGNMHAAEETLLAILFQHAAGYPPGGGYDPTRRLRVTVSKKKHVRLQYTSVESRRGYSRGRPLSPTNGRRRRQQAFCARPKLLETGCNLGLTGMQGKQVR